MDTNLVLIIGGIVLFLIVMSLLTKTKKRSDIQEIELPPMTKTEEPQVQKVAPSVSPQTTHVVQTTYGMSENTKIAAAITAAIMHHRQG